MLQLIPKRVLEAARLIYAGKVFIFLGFVIIFFIALRPPFDPDMGWHLANGKYLLSHHLQVARSDIYSYTMPDFPLIMHEWVADVMMYALSISSKFGLLIMSVFFALISTLAFVTASFGVKAKREHKMIAAILTTIASIPVLGVRPQMISLLALAIIIFIILRFRVDQKTRAVFFLPLIFFLWVNLHGGFAVGLFFIGLFIGIELLKSLAVTALKNKKRAVFMRIRIKIRKDLIAMQSFLKLIYLFLASALATLLNPYGWRVYIEVFTTIFDTYAKSNINEWMPVAISNPMSYEFLIYVSLLAILLLFSYKKIDFTYLTISLVFLYLALSSWRHMPLFLIVSTPLWVGIVEKITGEELLNIIRKKYFLPLLLLAIFFIARQQLEVVVPKSLSVEKLSEGIYPYKAVEYLKNNPIEGNMFNEYNWGGFLIWRYPEKKVFIDGRMPSWKIGDYRVFQDFNTIGSVNEGWDELLRKYDVAFSLVYNDQPNQLKYGYLKWEKVYGDDLAAIYKRPQ